MKPKQTIKPILPATEQYIPGTVYYNAFCNAPFLLLEAKYTQYYGRSILVQAEILWLDKLELQTTSMDIEDSDFVIIPTKELQNTVRHLIKAWKKGALHRAL